MGFFQQNLIVLAQCDAEDNGGDIFETVNPLFAFAPLSSNIEHAMPVLSENGYGKWAEALISRTGFLIGPSRIACRRCRWSWFLHVVYRPDWANSPRTLFVLLPRRNW